MSNKPRSVEIGKDARDHILRGALLLAKTVATTFGPMGRNAIIDRFAGLLSTRDGVTVAREIDLPNPLENQGCQILKQACIKVNDDVGDGTTQTAILAAEMLREGHRLIAAGFHPADLIRGMRAAVKTATWAIGEMAIPVETQEQIQQVAFLSSNRDLEIATLLAEATMAVGKNGLVVIEDGQGIESSLELKEGMEIDSGMVSQSFVDDFTKMNRTINAPLVAVVNAHLRTVEDVQDLMETASQWPQNELLIFCRSIAGEALNTLTLNLKEKIVRSCAVEAPGIDYKRPDILADIAALSGATFVDPIACLNHQAWDAEWFGSLRKVTVGLKKTLLEAYPEAKNTVAGRLDWLKGELALSVSDYDRDQIRKRIAKLSGGLAIIKVGGPTESELKDRRARVEDALGAVKAALRGGLVPGGGMAYLASIGELEGACPDPEDIPEGESAGWGLVIRALGKPLTVLAANAGYEGSVISSQLVGHLPCADDSCWKGWDAMTGQVRDLRMDPPVVDPALVPLASLDAALSVAIILLTVEASIFPDKED